MHPVNYSNNKATRWSSVCLPILCMKGSCTKWSCTNPLVTSRIVPSHHHRHHQRYSLSPICCCCCYSPCLLSPVMCTTLSVRYNVLKLLWYSLYECVMNCKLYRVKEKKIRDWGSCMMWLRPNVPRCFAVLFGCFDPFSPTWQAGIPVLIMIYTLIRNRSLGALASAC